MLIEPRTPAEFKALALKAIDLEHAPDPTMLLAALDEIVGVIEQACSTQPLVSLTPCQLFVGRIFLEAVQELVQGDDLED